MAISRLVIRLCFTERPIDYCHCEPVTDVTGVAIRFPKEIGPSFSTVAVLISKGSYNSQAFPIKTRETVLISALFKVSLRRETLKNLDKRRGLRYNVVG